MSKRPWILVSLAFIVVLGFLLSLQQQVRALGAKVGGLSDQVHTAFDGTEGDPPPPAAPAAETHALAEAQEAVTKLGSNANAESIAAILAAIDAWTVKPDDQAEFEKCTSGLSSRLRKKVAEEVVALQKSALEAPTGLDGAKKHAEAGRILSLYPMSDAPAVLEEAKKLSAAQGELPFRLETIRRQRYNSWAMGQIEAAINGYNSIASSIPGRTDRGKLADSLVDSIREVDPALLEPSVLEMYNYIIDYTKKALYEQERIDLVKRMTDPAIKRKAIGDF